MSENNTIHQTHTISASRDKVFKALTEPAHLESWWTTRSSSDPKSGGSFEFVWEFSDDSRNGKQAGEYKVVVPGEKIVYPWETGPNAEMTQVEFTLADEGDTTSVHLNHSGFGSAEEWGSTQEMINGAWEFFLGNLKSYLENGEDNRAAMMGQVTK